MPIRKCVNVERFHSECVSISNREIVDKLEETDAKEVIIGLLTKFPSIIGQEISNKTDKVFPGRLKNKLIEISKKTNQPIDKFVKIK